MDELLGKKTPYSAPAEQAVIGSMLIDPRCIPEVLEKLKPDEFYVKLNRYIWCRYRGCSKLLTEFRTWIMNCLCA